MNTFALVLLAFPFYLATKGKLVEYMKLATKNPVSTTPVTSTTPTTPTTPTTSTTGSVG